MFGIRKGNIVKAKEVGMQKQKSYHPLAAGYIISLAVITAMLAGAIYLVILGVIRTYWFNVVVGIIVSIQLSFIIIKIITWKVVLTDEYIQVPVQDIGKISKWGGFSSIRQNAQKIMYIDILNTKMDESAQTLNIYCRGRATPNLINVKAYTKKQAYKMMNEINSRVEKLPNQKIIECTCTDECASGYNPNCTCTHSECHCRELKK